MNLCIAKSNKNCAIETFINNHVKYLRPQVIICNGYFPGEFEEKKGSIYPFLYSSRYVRGALKKMVPKLFHHLYSRSLAAYLRLQKIDVVLAEYGLVGANVTDACQIAGVPLVTIFHGFDATEHNILKKYSARYKRLFSYAAGIIAVSKEMKEKLLSLGADPDTTYWNPYGVDLTLFYPQAKPEIEENIRFIFVGRLTPKKAPDLLIKAFYAYQQERPNSTLLMVGGGELKQECKKLIDELHMHEQIVIQEETPPERIPGLLRGADIYVQHSIMPPSGDSEGTPNSILEASASGLPVISTWHGGIPDIIKHNETGFLVPEKDIASMAHYMKVLADNPAQRKVFGEAGRNFIKDRFSLQASIAAIETILKKAAGKA